MEIKIVDAEIAKGRATVAVTGSLTRGEDLDALRGTIDDLLGQGYKHIALDLSAVGNVDSAGLGEFVRIITSVSQHGGKLKLWRPLPKRIEDLLSITRLLDSFDSPLPNARWNATVWVTVGVLLTLAFILITRFSGVAGLL
jgi:anti-anti-sigma factor